MSRLTYWKDSRTWVCSKHLPSIEIPAYTGACPFVGCDSIRPKHGRPTPTDEEPAPMADAVASVEKTTTTVAQTPVETAETASTIKVRQAPNVDLCSWFRCDKGPNGGPAPSRPRSKYCSKDCSNKNARYRYKTKQKNNG